MERAKWTDERLDERVTAIDTTIDHGFEELRAQRAEMRADRDELRREMRADRDELRLEMRAGFAEVRADISALQRQVTQIVTGLAIALLGAVAAGIVATL